MRDKNTIIVIILLGIMAIFFTISVYRLFPYIRTIFKYDDVGYVNDTDTLITNDAKNRYESVNLMYLVGAQCCAVTADENLCNQ